MKQAFPLQYSSVRWIRLLYCRIRKPQIYGQQPNPLLQIHLNYVDSARSEPMCVYGTENPLLTNRAYLSTIVAKVEELT